MGTPHGLTVEQRLLRWINKDPASGCWLWTGARHQFGYGVFGPVFGRSVVLAHRVTYEVFKGEIPKGLHLDHLCRTPACVNPDHLEPVTCRENLVRGIGFAAVNSAKVQCINGHPFDVANTYRPKRGRRECRTCHKLRARRKRAALKEAVS